MKRSEVGLSMILQWERLGGQMRRRWIWSTLECRDGEWRGGKPGLGRRVDQEDKPGWGCGCSFSRWSNGRNWWTHPENVETLYRRYFTANRALTAPWTRPSRPSPGPKMNPGKDMTVRSTTHFSPFTYSWFSGGRWRTWWTWQTCSLWENLNII